MLGNPGYEFQRMKYLKIPLVPAMAHLGVCAYLERYNTVPVSSVYWTLAKPKGVANNVLRQVLYPLPVLAAIDNGIAIMTWMKDS